MISNSSANFYVLKFSLIIIQMNMYAVNQLPLYDQDWTQGKFSSKVTVGWIFLLRDLLPNHDQRTQYSRLVYL